MVSQRPPCPPAAGHRGSQHIEDTPRAALRLQGQMAAAHAGERARARPRARVIFGHVGENDPAAHFFLTPIQEGAVGGDVAHDVMLAQQGNHIQSALKWVMTATRRNYAGVPPPRAAQKMEASY